MAGVEMDKANFSPRPARPFLKALAGDFLKKRIMRQVISLAILATSTLTTNVLCVAMRHRTRRTQKVLQRKRALSYTYRQGTKADDCEMHGPCVTQKETWGTWDMCRCERSRQVDMESRRAHRRAGTRRNERTRHPRGSKTTQVEAH